MSQLKTHYVVATAASFSHVPPFFSLCLSFLNHNPDLLISVILHANNVDKVKELEDGHSKEVTDRLKLYPLGEKTSMKDAASITMTMAYKSGEAYGGILGAALQDEATPFPSTFIFDLTSAFYTQVKEAVEANFKGVPGPRVVAYLPLCAGQTMYHVGSLESGSIRWIWDAMREVDPNAADVSFEELAAAIPYLSKGENGLTPEAKKKIDGIVETYQKVVTNNEKVISIKGYSPFHMYEDWSTTLQWGSPMNLGFFYYLKSIQEAVLKAEEVITCFPSSVLEPEAAQAISKDTAISKNKPITEFGWFPVKPKADWGEGIKEFLDRHGERSVVYLSFGTIVDAGDQLVTMFDFLESEGLPFIYACGSQRSVLPKHVQEILDKAEKDGRGLAPDWCDQIGVLSHPSVMCFVSHCGVNSMIESILAGVPIIAWGRRWDQILNGSNIYERKLGYELIQQREGYGLGKEIIHRPGEITKGTAEAMTQELKLAFDQMKGKEGETYRENCKAMASEIMKKREGVWDEAVANFGKEK